MPSFSRLALACAALLSAAALPATGFAKEEPHTSAAAFQAVLDCRKVADNTARLACYDAAAAAVGQAEAKGDIVVIDRAQAQKAHRQAFGLPVPSLDFLTRALKTEDIDKLDGVVKSARMDANGRWTMQLEDGAQWRQIAGDLLRDPHAGSKVVIHRGALGSFMMSVDGQAYIKVHRDI
jgi:hypothetical protein